MIRRYGEPVRAGQRYIRRPGIYAVLLRGDHILATHQAAPVPEFQLPGGGIDRGESPVAALHREVLEETGWRIAGPRRVRPHRRFTYMPDYDLWAEKICAVFVARPVLRLGPPTEPGHSAVWVPARLAAEMVASPGDRAAVRAVLAG